MVLVTQELLGYVETRDCPGNLSIYYVDRWNSRVAKGVQRIANVLGDTF